MSIVWISTPGAATKTAWPELLNEASASFWSVAATPMTPRSPAGKVGVPTVSFPTAATTTTPFDHA